MVPISLPVWDLAMVSVGEGVFFVEKKVPHKRRAVGVSSIGCAFERKATTKNTQRDEI